METLDPRPRGGRDERMRVPQPLNFRFLGVGGAFDPEFGSSAAVAETGAGTVLLIDCGCTTYSDLRRTGRADQITHILITHLHDDHVGSLGSLIYHHFYITGRKAELLFPPGLRDPLMALLGQQHTSGPVGERVVLREMSPDPAHPSRIVGTTRIDWLETTGLHQKGMPSFAYVLQGEETVAYSGDLGDPDFLFRALEERGLIGIPVFHDIFYKKVEGGPHAWYKDVERHLDRWAVRGYHNNPTAKPDDCRVRLVWEDPGFAPHRPGSAAI